MVATAPETAGALTVRIRAASITEPVAATSTKVLSWLNVMIKVILNDRGGKGGKYVMDSLTLRVPQST
jgi:hypothetical protein